MKWTKVEGKDYYSCRTPVGRYDVIIGSNGYNTYLGVDRISAGKDLEIAKEEARVHLQTLYYRIKLHLELDE